MLVTSNFSFSHSVFKSLVQQTRKNQSLFGKGLRRFNLFPNKPMFLCVYYTNLLKTLWKKGEIVRQFLLSPQWVLPFRRTHSHFLYVKYCRLQTLSVWKSLNFVVWERDNSVIVPGNRNHTLPIRPLSMLIKLHSCSTQLSKKFQLYTTSK